MSTRFNKKCSFIANNCSFVPPPSGECVNHYQMNYREIINLSKTLNRDAMRRERNMNYLSMGFVLLFNVMDSYK